MTNIVVGQRQLPGRHNHLALDVAKSATRCQLCNTQEGTSRCADVNQMSGRGVKVKVLARDKEVPGSQGSTKEVPGDTRVCHGTPTSLAAPCGSTSQRVSESAWASQRCWRCACVLVRLACGELACFTAFHGVDHRQTNPWPVPLAHSSGSTRARECSFRREGSSRS